MKRPLVTVEEFNNYSLNMEDSPEVVKLKMDLLTAATEIVESYLGYPLESDQYHEHYIGTGSNRLFLDNRPVDYVDWLSIDGNMVDFKDYHGTPDSVCLYNSAFPHNSRVEVDYSTSFQKVPAIVKTTVLRIATLLLSECGENIAVTSKSFADGSRSFANYTNYDKFLSPLKGIRRFEL